MAIMGPADLPVILHMPSDPLKAYALAKLGHPNVDVEVKESQMEIALRTTCDWIAGYFPREQRLAVFYTSPLQPTYPMPRDAYWIQEVTWDPVTTRIDDIFGAEAYLFNPGIIGGMGGGFQNLLLDYHLLQSYRKFSQKILGTEGRWEVLNEVDGGPGEQLIRLVPTPKGTFPVLVLYIPVVRHFRSPQAKMLVSEYLLAEVKEMVGSTRRKLANVPTPGGGTLGMDGDALVQEAQKMKEELTKKAINLGEPCPIVMF